MQPPAFWPYAAAVVSLKAVAFSLFKIAEYFRFFHLQFPLDLRAIYVFLRDEI